MIATAPAGGWGIIGREGVTVNNTLHSYGHRSDATNVHWFDNFPNPGGESYVGNAGFSLTMASAPGAATLSAISLSFGRDVTNVLGAEYLLDPSVAVTTIVASGLSVAYPLPLPVDPGLAGLTVRAQSLHLENGNTLATSRGLEFTIALLPAPVINSVLPTAPAANATVTVTGTHFHNGMELRVAGNLVPILTQTETTITFTHPSGVLCDAAMSLTNVGGPVGTSTINRTPVLVSMTPGGPAAGGNLFFINGQDLGGATVTFGNVPMTNFLVQNLTNIVGYAPPGQVGPVTVVVTSPTGCQTSGTYTYQ